jgi:tRNA(Ile)-lysidine synthase
MDMLLKQIRANILDRQLLRSGEGILVAVSGGVDSMVLLHILNSLAAEMKWDLTVVHLNHHLRGRSSDADARFVETLTRRWGLRFSGSVAEVPVIARQNRISLEMAGRLARHACFKQAALENKCTSIALAHHADDQLELFFLRLLRGSGEGLGGMQWISPLPNHPQLKLVRPLLNLPKAFLKEYAAANKLSFREDASNADVDFQRNRIRHELLPLLRKSYQAGLDSVVTRTMDILSAEADCMGDIARQWMKARRPDFSSLHVAVQRRALQYQLYSAGIIPDFMQVESLRCFPHRPVNLRKEQRHGPMEETQAVDRQQHSASCEATVSRDAQGNIYFPEPPVEDRLETDFELLVELGLRGKRDLGKACLRWRVENRRGNRTKPSPTARGLLECFDAEKLGERIILRHWRPGDRFRPIGMAEAVKLQDLFTNAKIPRNQRHTLLLATTEQGDIFWVEGLRISEQFKLTPDTRRRLFWQWRRS